MQPSTPPLSRPSSPASSRVPSAFARAGRALAALTRARRPSTVIARARRALAVPALLACLGAALAPAVAAAAPATAAPREAPAPGGAPRTALPPQGTLLFRGVHVLPMNAERVDRDRDVLVRNGRIERVEPAGRLGTPRGATVIEGRGRFLLPGLMEGHAHVPSPAAGEARNAEQERYAEDVLLLYVAHGVTSARGMLGHPWHLQLRDQLARGAVLGPRLWTASPSLNGNTVPDPATADRLVREYRKAGYDFLKLHPGLTRESFDAIVATAREVGIAYEGHVSDAVGVPRALEARQRAIDHLDGYLHALADPACFQGPVSPGFFGIGLVQCVDETRIPALVAATRAAGTTMAPTQSLLEQWADPPTPEALRARPVVRYLPPRVVEQWLRSRESFLSLQAVGAERAQRFVELRRRLIGELHAAGVPILLASDAPQVFNVPGDSALHELETYVASGLSPYEALRTGTVVAARYFGDDQRRGTVEPGRDADLLLVDGNPLEDVAALRRLHGVVLAGRWLPREWLDERLAELAARHGAQ